MFGAKDQELKPSRFSPQLRQKAAFVQFKTLHRLDLVGGGGDTLGVKVIRSFVGMSSKVENNRLEQSSLLQILVSHARKPLPVDTVSSARSNDRLIQVEADEEFGEFLNGETVQIGIRWKGQPPYKKRTNVSKHKRLRARLRSWNKNCSVSIMFC